MVKNPTTKVPTLFHTYGKNVNGAVKAIKRKYERPAQVAMGYGFIRMSERYLVSARRKKSSSSKSVKKQNMKKARFYRILGEKLIK